MVLLTAVALTAQEVGFDDFIRQNNIFASDEEESVDSDEGFALGTTTPLSVAISGEAAAGITVYVDDLTSADKMKQIMLGDIFSGRLNFSAKASNVDAFINLKLTPTSDGLSSLIAFDEAYVRGYFGSLSVEAGLRKLAWGKAIMPGPLDVINPLDYTDLLDITSLQNRKIATPMIHLSYSLGIFSEIEAVFVPSFTPQKFAQSGGWAPSQLTALPGAMKTGAIEYLIGAMPSDLSDTAAELAAAFTGMATPSYTESFAELPTEWLKYMQAGLRFTTTVSSADLGIQGYFGRLPRPAVILNGLADFWDKFAAAEEDEAARQGVINSIAPVVDYNYFAQLGVDYAQVLWGFNTRAELAFNLTKDLKGDDGAVYNPFIGWSLGVDRDITVKEFLLFNVNLQATENLRLFGDKINSNPALDAEAGTNDTSTRITLIASRKFFRDEFEVNFTGLWGIEDMDFYLIPGIAWTKENLVVRLYGGIFTGDSDGELGQYHKNNFIRMTMTYTF
jgi:hypothetical protein